ncbi:unnamed protein product [Vitrella brassicaformis CCMP3155]|uniref:Autophagy protein ATG17-like domain-containing protein n=2 Tax=Vitrella brassicaformis TaxID=1169539 RepID=A0A0G4FE55_VITBC|nr:unnamed protein product [Vitrella brassicaformis CCMP3155]|eukprot:CEM11250.1 unnamed protein product [Vitrella brassicaformis CCMP3155]
MHVSALTSVTVCDALYGEVLHLERIDVGKKGGPNEALKAKLADKWRVPVQDIILLPEGGGGGGADTDRDRWWFTFRRSSLDQKGTDVSASSSGAPQSSSASSAPSGLIDSGEGSGDDPFLRPHRLTTSTHVELEADEEELFRSASAQTLDPALQSFHNAMHDARLVVEGTRSLSMAISDLHERVRRQKRACRAVIANLLHHKDTFLASVDAFSKKSTGVHARHQSVLEGLDAAIGRLREVELHPAMRLQGRHTLADVVPEQRIRQFAASCGADHDRIRRRIEQLRKVAIETGQHTDGELEKMNDFCADETVEKNMHELNELLRQQKATFKSLLQTLPPQPTIEASTTISMVGVGDAQRPQEHPDVVRSFSPEAAAELLAKEKQQHEYLGRVQDLHEKVKELYSRCCVRWSSRCAAFLEHLREVSSLQSRIHQLSSQGVVFEETLNKQKADFSHLSHIDRMPSAYQAALTEIARRRTFKAKYVARAMSACDVLTRMREEEEERRRTFMKRHGVHLPAEFIPGLEALPATISVDIPDFDEGLPQIDLSGPLSASGGGSGVGGGPQLIEEGLEGSDEGGTGIHRSFLTSSGPTSHSQRSTPRSAHASASSSSHPSTLSPHRSLPPTSTQGGIAQPSASGGTGVAGGGGVGGVPQGDLRSSSDFSRSSSTLSDSLQTASAAAPPVPPPAAPSQSPSLSPSPPVVPAPVAVPAPTPGGESAGVSPAGEVPSVSSGVVAAPTGTDAPAFVGGVGGDGQMVLQEYGGESGGEDNLREEVDGDGDGDGAAEEVDRGPLLEGGGDGGGQEGP